MTLERYSPGQKRPPRPRFLFRAKLGVQTWGRLNWQRKAADWKDVAGFRGPDDVERPAGQWNRLEAFCRDDRITLRLNGQVVNRIAECHPREGELMLQCEGAELLVRRWELLPLPEEDP